MERSLFFGSIGDDRRYVSKDFAMWMAFFFSTGVSPMPETALQVTAGGGLTLNVAAGGCNINGRIGINESAVTLSVGLPDGAYNRIDAVVARLNTTERVIQLLLVEGDPDLTPAPPALIRTDDTYDLRLAQVLVMKGAESITAANITDKRPDETVCGFAAANMPLATAALFAQYAAIFDDFMNGARETLGEDVAGNLLNLINANANLINHNQFVVLWENESPNSNFLAQTIALDLSAYRFIVVDYAAYKGAVRVTGSSARAAVGENMTLYTCTTTNRTRAITTSAAGLVIADCNRITTYGVADTTVDNAACIPMRVIGYK